MVDSSRNQSGRTDAGAASQSLTFHPALEGAYPDVIGAQDLDKIDVRALRTEFRVVPQFWSEFPHHRLVGVGYEQNNMRNTSVQ